MSDCKEAGVVAPVIDMNRCEGKADCLRVCPYAVFAIRVLTEEERRGLSFPGRMKSFFHGHKKAFAVNAEQCHACGLCVSACPEKAITLKKVG